MDSALYLLSYNLLRNFVQTSYHLLKAHPMDLPLLCTACWSNKLLT